MSQNLTDQIALLRSEIEIMMAERRVLLRIAGAAAAFVAELDVERLPEETYEAAEMLAEYLNKASEETMLDALQAVKAEIAPERGSGESATLEH